MNDEMITAIQESIITSNIDAVRRENGMVPLGVTLHKN